MMTVSMKQTHSFAEPALIAMQTIRAHKLRTFLTLLGVILSVCTLIIVVGLIEGTNRYIQDRVANMGSNVFLVLRFPIITDAQEFVKALRRNKNVTWDDYVALRDNLKYPKNVGVESRSMGTVRYSTQNLEDVSIRGVTASIGEMDVEEPATGRYIVEGDSQHRAMVTFIGSEVANKLYPGVDPIGHTLEIAGLPFEVVGMAKPIGTVLGQSQDNFVYMPIETFLKIYGSNRSLSINIQASGAEWMARTQEEARVLMRARRHLRHEGADEQNRAHWQQRDQRCVERTSKHQVHGTVDEV